MCKGKLFLPVFCATGLLMLSLPCFSQEQAQPAAVVQSSPAVTAPVSAAVAAVPALPSLPPMPVAEGEQVGTPEALVSSNTTNVVFAPTQDRDPMVSVQDVRDLEYERNKVKIEREKQLAAQRAAKIAAQKKVDPEETARQVERTTVLQGIVGDQVIIQGKFYSAGQTLPNNTKILKIDADSVTFRYNKRVFIKRVAI